MNPPFFFLLFLGSTLTSWGILRACMWIFQRYDLLDNPKKYGYDRNPVPYGVGIILVVNFCLWSGAIWNVLPQKMLLVVLFGIIVTLISFVDDRVQVPAKIRLIIQIIIGAVIGLTSIKIGYISNIFGGILYLDTHMFEFAGLTIYTIPFIFTIVWYVLVFNAINWSDGIPGLTSGMSAVIFFIIGILAVRLYHIDTTLEAQQNSIFVLSIVVVLLPSVIVLCLHDFHSRAIM